MPNTNRIISPFLPTGNPDTSVEAATPPTGFSPYAQGDLGGTYDTNDKCYQKVLLDSGATSATPTGAVAAAQLAYWKDRANYIVTNDSRFGLRGGVASSFRNNIAGLFRSSVTAGYQCWVLQRGRAVSVKEAGSATGGMLLVSDTSVTVPQALGVAINTAPPCVSFGVVTVATAAGACTADFDLPNIP